MKAYARPPYGSFWGALLVFGMFALRTHESAVRLGHVTATNAGLTMLLVALMLGVVGIMLRMRRFRIAGDRLVVTRVLGPGRIASYPVSDIEVLQRRKGGLRIALKNGVIYSVPDVYWGAKEMFRLLLSDEVRRPGFEPTRVIQAQL